MLCTVSKSLSLPWATLPNTAATVKVTACCLAIRADYTAHEGRWETTNQHFYVDMPADKRLSQPDLYDTPLDKFNFIRAGLTKECYDASSKVAETSGGRAGARGKTTICLAVMQI